MGDDSVFQLKGGITGVIRGGGVFFTGFVVPFWDVGCAEAIDRFDIAENVVDHITPVAEHIDDDAASVFFAVVP